MKEVFGKVKMSEGFMSSGTRYVAVYGKEIVRTMLTYIPSYNSFYIKIPPAILGAEEDIVKEYVRTFYDDEGSASLRLNKKTNEWKRNITLVSNSNVILNQIKDILVKKKISTNRIIRNRPIGHRDKTYILGITGKQNFIAFREKIGFKHPRKLKMLTLIVESYNSTSKNEAKFIELKEKIKELAVP